MHLFGWNYCPTFWVQFNTGTQLFIGDKCLGLSEALIENDPLDRVQRCMVHFYRNVFSIVPRGKVKLEAAMLKSIHAQEVVETSAFETLVYMEIRREYW